jgi:dihydroflavonol-4-reductase
VNPAFLIGNSDTKPSSGRLILMAYNKKMMFVPSGGKNFVSAKHAAEAICQALTHGKSGEKYILGGKNLSFRSFYQLQSEVGGYKQKIFVLPDWILKVAGKAGDMLRFAGIKTDVCTRNLNQLLIQEYYDSSKAEKALGLKKTVLSKDIEKALKWFKQMDYIS